MTKFRSAPSGAPRMRSALLGVAALGLAAAFGLYSTELAAQAPGTGFATGYAANAGKPVDIEADVLEVDDKKKTAVFKGNVSATQGNINLKSTEIHVTYAAGGKKTANAAASDAAANPLGGNNEITQIDAKGNVFITMKPNKEGEKVQTAKGDWAIFDVKKQQVTMGGDVVLTQGENVLQGSKLVADLASGISRFENPGSVGGNGGRIRTLLVPPPKDKDKDKSKEKAKEGAQ